MQYLPLRDFDEVTSALNFDTTDCHVIGGCDLYTTKAAGADKKLYKDIEHSLESQYASLLSFSAGLSTHQAAQAGASLNLSRASPFGSLSQISSRRTFAYLIATLNASHPDYDFSHILRPADFRREKSLKRVMNTMDTTLSNLRPKYSSSFQDETSHWSTIPVPQTPHGSEKWNPRMWRLIDQEMALRECSIYCYAPDEDPYDGEEGSLWSFNYFFFNKARKRVCYLYLRGLSIIGNSPPQKTPVRAKRAASGTWSLGDEETGKKRARYWLGDKAGDVEYVAGDDEEVEGENWEESEVLDQGDEPRFIPESIDTSGTSPCKGRSRRSTSKTMRKSSRKSSSRLGSSDTNTESSAKEGSPVRGISEEIAASMDH